MQRPKLMFIFPIFRFFVHLFCVKNVLRNLEIRYNMVSKMSRSIRLFHSGVRVCVCIRVVSHRAVSLDLIIAIYVFFPFILWILLSSQQPAHKQMFFKTKWNAKPKSAETFHSRKTTLGIEIGLEPTAKNGSLTHCLFFILRNPFGMVSFKTFFESQWNTSLKTISHRYVNQC